MNLQYILNPRSPVQATLPIVAPLQNTPTPTPPSPSPPEPSTPKRNTALLTRDQRIQVRTLRVIKWTRKNIVKHLKSQGIDCTEKQVQYAEEIRSTPQKHRCDFKVLLDTFARRRIVIFIESSKRTRRMPYIEVDEELQLYVSDKIMRETMRKEGIFRRLVRHKPLISEKNRLLRLAFAHAHLNWIRNQWNTILWSDETWVTSGFHTRVWISRRVGEEYNSDCVVDKEQRKQGWMFWGSFSGGLGKGSDLFWEKAWEKINFRTYCERVLPLVEGMC